MHSKNVGMKGIFKGSGRIFDSGRIKTRIL